MKNHNTIVQIPKSNPDSVAFIQKDHLVFVAIIGAFFVYVIIEAIRRQRHVTRMLEQMFFQFQEREDGLWSHFVCVARDQALEEVGQVIAKASNAAEETKHISQEMALLREEILLATSEAVPLLRDWKMRLNEEQEKVTSATDVPEVEEQ